MHHTLFLLLQPLSMYKIQQVLLESLLGAFPLYARLTIHHLYPTIYAIANRTHKGQKETRKIQ
jgi:hypothetical protein